MHHTVATILKATIETSPPQNVDEVNNLFEDDLAAAMHSLCATVSTTLKATPGGLAFFSRYVTKCSPYCRLAGNTEI